MAAGRNRVQRVARFRYEDLAFADHFELISLHHNDCVGINADAEQLGMCRDYGFQVVLSACAQKYADLLRYSLESQNRARDLPP